MGRLATGGTKKIAAESSETAVESTVESPDKHQCEMGEGKMGLGKMGQGVNRGWMMLTRIRSTVVCSTMFGVLMACLVQHAKEASGQQFGGPVEPLGGVFEESYFHGGYFHPRSVLVRRQVVAGPPLPPARLVLSHRRNETLNVEIFDRRAQRAVFRQAIPPGQVAEVSLPRDSSGYVIETYQSIGPWGDVVQNKVTRPLPADVRYDVIVHQWQIQSIAIDRTGKSPSPIEDVQYQGRGVGRFVLPAGERLTDGKIDVYRTAIAADNPGLVAPLAPPTENDGPASDPLRQAIDELRTRGR